MLTSSGFWTFWQDARKVKSMRNMITRCIPLALLTVALVVPQTTRPNGYSLVELIAAKAVLLTLSKGLEYMTRQEHTCPVHPLQHNQPCPLSYFKALANASETYVTNLKKLQAMDPENPEVLNLLGQGIIIHKKIQLQLERVESLSEEQQGMLRLTQERNFTERDLKILALLKERGYKDIPQEVAWQSKKDEYTEVSPGIFYSHDFMQQYGQPHIRKNTP